MRTSRKIILFALGLPLLTATPAGAQICPNPIPITCGDTVTGDNSGGPNNITDYSCIGYFSEDGPEAVYLLDLAESWHVFASADPTSYFDAAIAILPDNGGDCDPAACIDGEDGGNPEEASADLLPGRYYIVVDGYSSGSSGTFELTVTCDRCTDYDNDGHDLLHPDCPGGDDCDDTDPDITTGTDADGDGLPAYNPLLCPGGNDCDDSDPNITVGMDADGDGYSRPDPATCPAGNDCDDTDPDAYPGATEICGDGIDQDCDGGDPPCPYCASLGAITCDSPITARNDDASATDLVDTYACLPYPETASEVAWTFSPQASGQVRVRLASAEVDLAVAVLDGAGACEGPACLVGADRVFGPGEELLLVDVEAGSTYYVVVDGWADAAGEFELTVECTVCQDADGDGAADLFCGGTDCDDQNPVVYPGAPEPCDGLDNNCDGQTDEGFDLQVDPLHCGQCDAACDPAQVCDLGTCAAACADGRIHCGGGCFDSLTDVRHCGGCDQACDVPNADNACQDGSCSVAGCLDDFGDCNATPDDGCEVDLTTDPDNCGGCDQACPGYPNAGATCRNSRCAMGACQPDFGDCNNSPLDGCETRLIDDTQHCGACGVACEIWEFCVGGACTDECPDGLTNCAGVCMDTTADPRNCGGCGRVCAFDNATDPGCQAGVCQLGACDPGYGDCNDFPDDGCETLLGSIDHCDTCGDRCDYANATGVCEVDGCRMGACHAGYTDCNESAIDGCEIDTDADHDNCGACGHACGRLEACQGGACVVGCPDADDDGFADAECGGNDCDDADRDVRPGGEEACNGRDDDCDGAVDEGFDADGDGHRDQVRCGEFGQDCDDGDADVHPGAIELCGDGVDQDCDGQDLDCSCPDADRDGAQAAACGGRDCDDNDPTVHPAAAETCNQIDDDCDDQTDEGGVCGSGTQGCGCQTGGPGPAWPLAFLLMLLGMRLRRE